MTGLDGRRFRRLLIAVAAAAAAAGIGAGVGLHIALGSAATPRRVDVPALHGQAVWPAGRRAAPAFVLHDQNEARVSLAAERGRTVLLAFMDPLCKQECPLEGRALAAAERQVAPAQRPVLLIVSVNPKASPAEARSASRHWDIADHWHWLLGSRAQLAQVWRAYDITVLPEAGDIVHSTAVYVIDRRGFERVGLIAPFLPPFLADDLRVLAHEGV